MPNIDKRLNKPDCEINVTEDFNRVLGLVDALENRVKALETTEPTEPTETGGGA